MGKLSGLRVAFIMLVTVMIQPGDKMTLICISAGVFLLWPRLTLLLLHRLHISTSGEEVIELPRKRQISEV